MKFEIPGLDDPNTKRTLSSNVGQHPLDEAVLVDPYYHHIIGAFDKMTGNGRKYTLDSIMLEEISQSSKVVIEDNIVSLFPKMRKTKLARHINNSTTSKHFDKMVKIIESQSFFTQLDDSWALNSPMALTVDKPLTCKALEDMMYHLRIREGFKMGDPTTFRPKKFVPNPNSIAGCLQHSMMVAWNEIKVVINTPKNAVDLSKPENWFSQRRGKK